MVEAPTVFMRWMTSCRAKAMRRTEMEGMLRDGQPHMGGGRDAALEEKQLVRSSVW